MNYDRNERRDSHDKAGESKLREPLLPPLPDDDKPGSDHNIGVEDLPLASALNDHTLTAEQIESLPMATDVEPWHRQVRQSFSSISENVLTEEQHRRCDACCDSCCAGLTNIGRFCRDGFASCGGGCIAWSCDSLRTALRTTYGTSLLCHGFEAVLVVVLFVVAFLFARSELKFGLSQNKRDELFFYKSVLDLCALGVLRPAFAFVLHRCDRLRGGCLRLFSFFLLLNAFKLSTFDYESLLRTVHGNDGNNGTTALPSSNNGTTTHNGTLTPTESTTAVTWFGVSVLLTVTLGSVSSVVFSSLLQRF